MLPCSQLGIQVKHTSPYNPQANPVERKNRDIKLYLSKFCGDNHKNWDENIQPMLFSLRTAVHRSTGYTPARLLLGKELHGPLDILLDHNMVNESSIDFKNYAEKLAVQLRNANIYALENRMISGEIQKNYYDLGRREVKFEEGDLVLCRSHFQSSAIKDFAAKLAPKYEGPYIVLERQLPNTYLLGDPVTKEAICCVPIHFLRKYSENVNPINYSEKLDEINSNGSDVENCPSPPAQLETTQIECTANQIASKDENPLIPKSYLGKKRGRPSKQVNLQVPVKNTESVSSPPKHYNLRTRRPSV